MARIASTDNLHDEPVLVQAEDVADELAAVHLSEAETLSGDEETPQVVQVSIDTADGPRAVQLVFCQAGHGAFGRHHKHKHMHGHGQHGHHGPHGRGLHGKHGKRGGSPPPAHGIKDKHMGGRHCRGRHGSPPPPSLDGREHDGHRCHGRSHRMPPPPANDGSASAESVSPPLGPFGRHHSFRGGRGHPRGPHPHGPHPHGGRGGFRRGPPPCAHPIMSFEIPDGVDAADIDFDLEAHYFAGEDGARPPPPPPGMFGFGGRGRGRHQGFMSAHGHHVRGHGHGFGPGHFRADVGSAQDDFAAPPPRGPWGRGGHGGHGGRGGFGGFGGFGGRSGHGGHGGRNRGRFDSAEHVVFDAAENVEPVPE